MTQFRSCTVFVGNIPYDASEEELKAIFSKAGAVESFRLVYDKDTKQPKGYGFCDYADAETAVAAIRNLNDVEFSGRRLRIDLADNALRARELGGSAGGPLKALPPSGGFQAPAALPALPPPLSMPPPPSAAAPVAPPPPNLPLPPGMAGMPGATTVPGLAAPDYSELLSGGATTTEAALADVTAHTEICQVVSGMPRAQLQLCLASMQRLATEAPEESRAMLHDNPQLCYALLHAQLLLGLQTEPSLPASAQELQQMRLRPPLRPGFGMLPPQGFGGASGLLGGLGINPPPMPKLRPPMPGMPPALGGPAAMLGNPLSKAGGCPGPCAGGAGGAFPGNRPTAPRTVPPPRAASAAAAAAAASG